MRFSSFVYLLKSGVRNIKLNKLMSIASVAVLTACFVLVGLTWLVDRNVPEMLGYVEGQNEIVAFVSDKVADDKIENITKSIKELDGIESCIYLSREEVLESQREVYGDLIDTLPSNPFPPTYHIKLSDISKVPSVSAAIEKITGIEKVNAPTEVASILTGIRRSVSTTGLIIMLVLITVSLVIIANTIRLTVFGRRKEINIMKYVGATNGFIRLPFVIEGMTLGLVSAVLSFILIAIAYNVAADAVISSGAGTWFAAISSQIIPFKRLAMSVLLVFAAAGIATGALGSFISIRKHLKV